MVVRQDLCRRGPIRFAFQEESSKGSLAIFAMEALADFRTVASVAPSSRYLTRAMLEPLPLRNARVVVELGCGTGAMTQALLNRMPLDATLLAFEINPRFYEYLSATVSDSRLVLINASAEMLVQELHRRGIHHVDAVLSSLGLAFMSDSQRETLLAGLSHLMDENSAFTQYQYLHGLQFQNGRLGPFDVANLLRGHFNSVRRSIVWRNLPPAFVFVSKGPFRSASI